MRVVVLRVCDMPLASVVRISRDADVVRVQIDATSITAGDAHLLEQRLNGDPGLLEAWPDHSHCHQVVPHTV